MASRRAERRHSTALVTLFLPRGMVGFLRNCYTPRTLLVTFLCVLKSVCGHLFLLCFKHEQRSFSDFQPVNHFFGPLENTRCKRTSEFTFVFGNSCSSDFGRGAATKEVAWLAERSAGPDGVLGIRPRFASQRTSRCPVPLPQELILVQYSEFGRKCNRAHFVLHR